MKFKSVVLIIVVELSLVFNSLAQTSLQNDTMYIRCTQALNFAFDQANRMIKSLPVNPTQIPSSLSVSGGLNLVNPSDWTSGFFPGELWYLSEYKKDAVMQGDAKKYTQLLQAQQYTTNTHDLGFMMYCTYGNGLRIANVAGYKDILVQSANSLQGRYNSKVGCMRSWDFGSYSYPVIIDNMMNLELMFWATKNTGDSIYYKGAVSHALNTLKNHYRTNYSSYHLVDYSPSTGAVLKKQTVQGYNDASSWARGQAWGLYGFTMCYNETGNVVFLDHARHVADYIISCLPTDYVPYWDYNDPAIPNAPRDASAAAIAASGLLELYRLGHDAVYFRAAEKILWNLSSPVYMNGANEKMNFLLKHSTANKPANSLVDVPLIYADYYFVEALIRYVKLKNVIASVSQNFANTSEIEVFPTVFNQSFTVQSSFDFDKIQLVDINGRIVLTQLFSSINQRAITRTPNLSDGIYLLNIFSSDKRVGQLKVLKRN